MLTMIMIAINCSVRLGQVRLGQVRLGQVRLGQVRLGQVRLGQFRLGQVRLGQVMLGQVRLGQVRLGQVRLGWRLNQLPLAAVSYNLNNNTMIANYFKVAQDLILYARFSCRSFNPYINSNGETKYYTVTQLRSVRVTPDKTLHGPSSRTLLIPVQVPFSEDHCSSLNRLQRLSLHWGHNKLNCPTVDGRQSLDRYLFHQH